MNSREWLLPVLRLRNAMSQAATGVEAELKLLPEIKAVIFDVYGTLVISGSGDVGSADMADHSDRILQSLEAVAMTNSLSQLPTMEMIHEEIEHMNRDGLSDGRPQSLSEQGADPLPRGQQGNELDASAKGQTRSEIVSKPEVDIVEVWRRILSRCGLDRAEQGIGRVVELAAQYEARANPTWPMPGSSELLAVMRDSRIAMGIVSNAQVFTPPLVEDLLDSENLEMGGFDLNLCFFSNRFRQSKPGPRLFDALRDALTRRGILPYEAVYVGNDMLNDVWAASQAGLRTAWFAGDTRSIRAREDDPRCRSLRPDVVLTNLLQLLECLRLK